MGSKVARTDISAKDVSQIHSSNELGIFLKTSEPAESTQDKTKKLFDQGEFINLKYCSSIIIMLITTQMSSMIIMIIITRIFHYSYYVSNKTHFSIIIIMLITT